jgi:hypothetical protein
MKLLTLTLMLALALLASGAKKDRDWKIARVLDSNSDLSSYVTGSTTNLGSISMKCSRCRVTP